MKSMMFPNLFNDPASMVALNVSVLHDYVMVGVCFIAGLVFAMIVLAQYGQNSFNSSDELVLFEVMWTLGPIILVLYVVFSTVPLMSVVSPQESGSVYPVSVEARQWYWMYNGKGAYLGSGGVHRGLDTENVLPIPYHQYTKFSMSSGDVMHSFAVPSLGLKVDALPGRMSYDYCFPLLLGSFYGQCSEICGANHSFMPMNIEVLPQNYFNLLV